jgi:transcriptional regulator with XRE-family HTH domain
MTGKEFGDRIKQLREVEGLTQTELARELGLSQQVITKWETGLKLKGPTAGVLLTIQARFPDSYATVFGNVRALPGVSRPPVEMSLSNGVAKRLRERDARRAQQIADITALMRTLSDTQLQYLLDEAFQLLDKEP